VQPLLQVVHRVPEGVAPGSQRDLRRLLHEVVLDPGEGVPDAGALLETRVLVVGMVVGGLLMLAAFAAGTPTVVGHQWLIGLQRVLVGVTVGKDVPVFITIGNAEKRILDWVCTFTHLLSVFGWGWRSSKCALACLGQSNSGLLLRLEPPC